MPVTEPATAVCPWPGTDPLYRAYHDREWGRPLWDERGLFEFLILEGAQAGLAWITILRKREAYRRAFAGFDPAVVAAYGDGDRDRLLTDPGIVRNRLKIEAAIDNARATVALHGRGTSLHEVLWAAVGGAPRQNAWRSMAEVPAQTAESEQLSKDLRRLGFRFVGPTIVYALMQAVGMVNDHLVGCPRWAELGGHDACRT